jgi:hypothetical protein
VTNFVLPVALILLGLIFYYAWIERWRYSRLAPAAAIEKIYRKLYRFGRPLAGERTKAETAYEFMQKLTHEMNAIRARSRFARLFGNAPKEIELLTELYQATLFAHTSIQKQQTRMAVNTWKRLRFRLLMARLRNSLNHVILSRHLRLRAVQVRRRISTTMRETLRSLKRAPSE